MNMSIFYAILIVVGICAGIALTWFLVELIITLKKTQKKVDDIHRQITPTIENIEQITTRIQPAIDKVDPLIERVSLSVDAANLELMRVDQILENVNVVSENAANASNSVSNIVNAPAELLNRASNKIMGLFGSKDDDEIYGELEDGDDDVEQILEGAKQQKKRFGRRVINSNEVEQEVIPKHQSFDSNNNPYVSFE